MSYLCCLCLFAYSGVYHILSCVFAFCFSSSCVPYVSVSLYCPFFISPSVFSNVYLLSQYSNQKLSNKPNYCPDHVLCVCKKSIQNEQIIFYLNDLNFFAKIILYGNHAVL
jgi:hypothetical protein